MPALQATWPRVMGGPRRPEPAVSADDPNAARSGQRSNVACGSMGQFAGSMVSPAPCPRLSSLGDYTTATEIRD
jgi:hypothetical protein